METRRDEHLDWFADQLSGRVPENRLDLPIGEQYRAILVDEDERIRRVLQCLTILSRGEFHDGERTPFGRTQAVPGSLGNSRS